MKKLILLILCLTSSYTFAANLSGCVQALPTNDPNFCTSFKSVAQCQCESRGIPSVFCKNMESLYSRMISIFGTLQRACAYQHDTDTQTCIDDWTCYRTGGLDSHGRPCASTGTRCEA